MATNFNEVQNERDLKFYKFVIAFFIFVAISIGLAVGANQLGNTYSAEAFVTNSILNKAMPEQITDDTEGSVTYGMTFYREKNENFDSNKDLPLEAFKYYYINSDGDKVYLEDGNYYPPEYYSDDENIKQGPVSVSLGFVYRAKDEIDRIQAKAKKVITIIVLIFTALIVAGLIYIWYCVWSKREDEKEEMQKMLIEQSRKK